MEHNVKAWLILLVTICAVSVSQSANCPTFNVSSPCKCFHGIFYGGNGTKVECIGITDVNILFEQMQKFRGFEVDYLKLTHLEVPYLPNGLFAGIHIKRLYFMASILDQLYSVVNSSSSVSPFSGLEDSLVELHISSTDDLSKWYWTVLKNLKSLKRIEIGDSPINFIGHVFSEIGEGSLESIIVEYSMVDRIHPQAFPELTNIKEASFANNNLPYLVRTMFPNPAPRLETLNFKSNRLFTLNENMFENMPALKHVDFSGNDFKSFESVVFSSLWTQLESFYMSDNPFQCDCNLMTLKIQLIFGEPTLRHDIDKITCQTPGLFKKTKIQDLVLNKCL